MRTKLTLLLVVAVCVAAVIFTACNVLAADATVHWTAVVDDYDNPDSGPVADYVIAYSTDSTALVAADIPDGWDVSSPLVDTASVGYASIPGTVMAFTVTGLDGSTEYYFSAKAVDDAGNYSLLGNIHSFTTADDVRPATVIIISID